MTEITPSMEFKPYPAAIEGLNGVYFAGQRMHPPGGLPSALLSGRAAVQYLCRDTNTLFVSEE
jgi:phytoene dehydrogenase-like protein